MCNRFIDFYNSQRGKAKMMRLFLVLLFFVTSFAFIQMSHARIPTSLDKVTCPEGAEFELATIFDPLYEKDIQFYCRLLDKNEYIKETSDGKRILAMTFKSKDGLFLNSLNIFKENKLIEFRKYSIDRVLQKWEIYDNNEKALFIFVQAAGKLEEFDTKKEAPIRTCSHLFEENKIIDAQEDNHYKTVSQIVLIDFEKRIYQRNTHLSLRDKSKKFLTINESFVTLRPMNMLLCIEEKIIPFTIEGEIIFQDQSFNIQKNDQVNLAVLKELLKKRDQDIIDQLQKYHNEDGVTP